MPQPDPGTLDGTEAVSNRVANALLRRVGADPAPIALWFEDQGALATAVLGVVKAGRSPLLPAPPATGFETDQLDDAGVRFVVTDDSAADAAFAVRGPTRTVIRVRALVEGAPATTPVAGGAPEPVVRHRRPPVGEGSELAQLQAGAADAVPLFCVHDLDGRANRYRRLAIELGEDQPVYGFESPFLLGYRVPVHDVADLADRYAREARRVQPTGRYQLFGAGFGGILAYEVACRLEADGAEVAFLGVLDAGPHGAVPASWRRRPPPSPWLGLRPPADPSWPVRRRLRYYGSIAKRTPTAFARHVAKRTGLDRATLPLEWAIDLRRHGRVRAATRPWYSWHELWALCGRDWAPARLRGDLCLFWSSDQPPGDPSLGWADVVDGRITVRPLRPRHVELIDDDEVATLAAELRSELDAVSSAGD